MTSLLRIVDDKDKQEDLSSQNPWFAGGLHFQCTGCGKCCTGAPGYVWVGPEEIEQMAAYLDIPLEEFSKRFLRSVDGRLSLKEHAANYDCVFLKDKQCAVYPVRPKQCSTYPFWRKNLATPQAWEDAARDCEGIRPQFPSVPLEKIEQQLALSEKIHDL